MPDTTPRVAMTSVEADRRDAARYALRVLADLMAIDDLPTPMSVGLHGPRHGYGPAQIDVHPDDWGPWVRALDIRGTAVTDPNSIYRHVTGLGAFRGVAFQLAKVTVVEPGSPVDGAS